MNVLRWLFLLAALVAVAMAVLAVVYKGRRPPLGAVIALLLIPLSFAAIYLARNWAYFTAPIPAHLTEHDRTALLNVALKRTGVAALNEAGEAMVIAPEHVTRTIASRCSPRQECIETRGSGFSQTCRKVKSHFDCAYELITKDGSVAIAYLSAAENAFFSSPLPNEKEDLWRHSPILADKPEPAAVKAELCELGYCMPTAIQDLKRKADAFPKPLPLPVPACRRGFEAYIVGRGNSCIAPDDPAVREFRDCKAGFCGPVMVALPRGRYMRGTSEADAEKLSKELPSQTGTPRSETPQHDVVIDYDLAVGKFEVTFDEWDACVVGGTCSRVMAPEDDGWGRGKRPVMRVSWSDINREFLTWLNARLGLHGETGYRLASDAEWEYAARAGTTTRTAFGNTLSSSEARVRDGSHSDVGRTAEAGSFAPNGFGLHDMHGNVAEWVQDCAALFDGHPPDAADSSARTRRDCPRRVVRGGSWNSTPELARSASRTNVDAGSRSNTVGFRVVRRMLPER